MKPIEKFPLGWKADLHAPQLVPEVVVLLLDRLAPRLREGELEIGEFRVCERQRARERECVREKERES